MSICILKFKPAPSPGVRDELRLVGGGVPDVAGEREQAAREAAGPGVHALPDGGGGRGGPRRVQGGKGAPEGQGQPAGQQGPHLPVRQEPHLREPGHDEAGAHLLTGPSRKDANQIQKCMQF